jgi:predicted DNA-binding transcriptional regulator AlpA
MATNSEFVDVAEVAKRLDISVSFLNKARLYGDGPPYVKIGRNVRYDWPETLEWARSKTRSSTSENTREVA